MWWEGPSWLSEPVSSWPKSEVCHQSLTEECIAEQKKSLAGRVVSETVLLVANQPALGACIPISNFSCCDKLFRVTALVHRFVRNLKIKAKILKEGTVCHEENTEAEIAHDNGLFLELNKEIDNAYKLCWPLSILNSRILGLERFSFECRNVIGNWLRDWLKRFAPLFHPIRSKTKTNCDEL